MAKTKKNTQTTVAKEIPKSVSSSLTSLFSDKQITITFFSVLVLSAFIIFQDFITGTKTFLFKDIGSDTVNGIYPLLLHNIRAYQEGIIPTWSLNWGLGQNVSPFYLREPFEFLLYPFGLEKAASGLGVLEFIKVIATGITFFYFLRSFINSTITSAIGALLFAFSGFVILGGTWCLFSSEAFMLALLLLGFEHAYKKNTCYFIPVAIFLIAVSQPVNLYIFGLFVFVFWETNPYINVIIIPLGHKT